MFDYTKAVLDIILYDVKRARYVLSVGVNAIYILHLSFSLIIGSGLRVVNAILLAISVCYFIFFLIYEKKKKELNAAKRIYKGVKIAITALPLSLTVYSACLATTSESYFSLLLAVLMTVGWILNVVMELLTYYITIRKNQLIEALNADAEPIKRVIEAPGRIVDRIKGKDTPAEEPTKTRRMLDTIVGQRREERTRAEEERRAEQKADRERKKAEKQAAKAAEKQAKRAAKRAKKG